MQHILDGSAVIFEQECKEGKPRKMERQKYLLRLPYVTSSSLKAWCPEGDLNPHGLAACGF